MALGSGLWLPQDKPDYPELDPLDPINLGLVGVWPLGEGRGLTARDISGRNNHGTINTTGYPWGKSHHGGLALSLPGTNVDTNSVTVPNSSSINIVGAISMACWAYPTISNAFQSLIDRSNGAGASRQYAMYLSSAGVTKIFVALGATNIGDVVVTPNWVVNQWNFVALTADGTNVRVYINGVLANTTASAALPTSQTQSLYLGREVGNNFSLNGRMDIPRIWARVLSPSEIARLYSEPYAGLLQDDTPSYRIAVAGGSNGVGSSAGVGAAPGVGASLSASVGSSAGTGAATGIGQGIDNSVGSSAGSATVTGVGKSLANSVGSSAGVATAPGVGTFTGGGTRGTAAGVGAASGVGASRVAATGTASGASTALAVAILPYWFQNPAPLPVWGVSAPPSGAWSAVAPSGAAWTKQFP